MENNENKKRKAEIILPRDIWKEILKYVWNSDNHVSLILVCKSFLFICHDGDFLSQVKMNYYPCLPIICKLSKMKLLSRDILFTTQNIIQDKIKASFPSIDENKQKWINIATCLISIYQNSKTDESLTYFADIIINDKIQGTNLNWLLIFKHPKLFFNTHLRKDHYPIGANRYLNTLLAHINKEIQTNDYWEIPIVPIIVELWKRYPSQKLVKMMSNNWVWYSSNNSRKQQIVDKLLDSSFPAIHLLSVIKFDNLPLCLKAISQIPISEYNSEQVINWAAEAPDQIYQKIAPYLDINKIDTPHFYQNLINKLRLDRLEKWEDLIDDKEDIEFVDKILVHRLWDNSNSLLWKKLLFWICKKSDLMQLCKYSRFDFQFLNNISCPILFTVEEVNTHYYLLHLHSKCPTKIIIPDGIRLPKYKEKISIIDYLAKCVDEDRQSEIPHYQWLFPSLYKIVLKNIRRCFCNCQRQRRLIRFELFWEMVKHENVTFPELSFITTELSHITCKICLKMIKQRYRKEVKNSI